MIHIIDTVDATFCKLPHFENGKSILRTSQVVDLATCIECYEAVALWTMRINERSASIRVP